CFDDLERSTIPIKDMLGYINQYVEHKNVKTFILCSEKAMSPDEKETFLRIKEKLIGQTIRFKLEVKTVVDSIIDALSNDTNYKSFLHERADGIAEILTRSETNNVRI